MILATIGSVQGFFVNRYVSGQRQCRLGYDSSPQCDSFQLGEIIRFFTRKGTLSLQSMIISNQNSQFYEGSIERLLEALRECPSYQLDSYHSHCGIRSSNFMPALRHLQWMCSLPNQIGICLLCWQKSRSEHSWRLIPAGGSWQYKLAMAHEKSYERRVGEHDHAIGKRLFTAAEHNWLAET